MSKFIAISGPAVTGKTSLVDELRNSLKEYKNIVYGPDIKETVWRELVDSGYFKEFSEIDTDREYMCIYLIRLIKFYEEELIGKYAYEDKLVILDGSWVDLLTYATLQMYYNSFIIEVQTKIFSDILALSNTIDQIYLTVADEEKYPVNYKGMRCNIVNFKKNRPLELKYYEMARQYKRVTQLPTLEIKDSRDYIITDLKKLGYLPS